MRQIWTGIRLRSSELPLLRVDMKFKHFLDIEEKRAEARRCGVLLTSPDDFVPAEIHFDGRTVPVKMRLKGDWVDHLDGHKWSFRVKVRGDESVFGMRVFSLQHPKTRNWETEQLFQEHLRREGVLGLRYRFVRLDLNGRDHGIFALEEHFSKELLESQQRREGVILKPDETGLWNRREVLKGGGFGGFTSLRHEGMQCWPLASFRSGKVAESPVLSDGYHAGIKLLEGFSRGELPASEVFKIPLLARFLAISELWSASHGLTTHNLRFYFDPVESRLEPIGFDANAQEVIRPGLIGPAKPWVGVALRDPAFARAYVEELERVSRPEYVVELEEAFLGSWEETLGALRAEWPDHHPDPWEKLRTRSRHLRDMLEIEELVLGRVYVSGTKGENVSVELHNPMKVPVEVLGFVPGDGPFLPATADGSPLLLPRRESAFLFPPFGESPSPITLSFGETELGSNPVSAVCRLLGTTREQRVPLEVHPQSPSNVGRPLATSVEELLGKHPFLRRVPGRDELHIAPGDWNVGGDLILPPGSSLHAEAGTTLRFETGAVVLANGPLFFRGEEEHPVRFLPQDEEKGWAGIVVLNSPPSSWAFVEIGSTSEIRRPGWITTGGVTFSESSVRFDHCRFDQSRGEDAVNVIRSEVVFSFCEFSDTHSDAFDGDFVVGEVNQCRFSAIGGDAVDVSGSRLDVRGVEVFGTNDKALSAGEDSRVAVSSLRVERAQIAVAAKDLSQVEIEELSVRHANVAVAAYTKKLEYGPARIVVHRLHLEQVRNRALAQTHSSISIGGVLVPEEDFDTDQLYRQQKP